MSQIELICGVCFANTLEYVDLTEPCPINHKWEHVTTEVGCISYYDCFCYCTNSKIVCDRNTTQILCMECAKELEITYTFLRKAKQAEMLFTQAIEKLETKSESDALQEDYVDDNEEIVEYECVNMAIEKLDALGDDSSAEVNELSDDKAAVAWQRRDAETLCADSVQANQQTECAVVASPMLDVAVLTKDATRNQARFTCELCGKTYTRRNRYNAHLRYHDKKLENPKSETCKICNKEFVTPHYLRQHMAVHSEQRPLYKCNECSKLYYSKTALENHARLHKGNAIVCHICSKQFSRRYEFNVHMRFHQKDYPFACTLCDKKFTIKGHLRTHMWRHQGLKLQCNDCGKLFTSTKALNEHSYTHTTMPYKCLYCDRGYPSKQKYKVHLKTTHEIVFDERIEQQINATKIPKPLMRRKLTLVQVDNAMREIEITADSCNNEEYYELLDVNLCD